jgi:hypothetical protein
MSAKNSIDKTSLRLANKMSLSNSYPLSMISTPVDNSAPIFLSHSYHNSDDAQMYEQQAQNSALMLDLQEYGNSQMCKPYSSPSYVFTSSYQTAKFNKHPSPLLNLPSCIPLPYYTVFLIPIPLGSSSSNFQLFLSKFTRVLAVYVPPRRYYAFAKVKTIGDVCVFFFFLFIVCSRCLIFIVVLVVRNYLR